MKENQSLLALLRKRIVPIFWKCAPLPSTRSEHAHQGATSGASTQSLHVTT